MAAAQRDLSAIRPSCRISADSGNVLDRELDGRQLGRKPALDPLNRVKHEIVESLRPGAGKRHLWRREWTPQTTTTPIPTLPTACRAGRALGEPGAHTSRVSRSDRDDTILSMKPWSWRSGGEADSVLP
jgi:hypothetical protein